MEIDQNLFLTIANSVFSQGEEVVAFPKSSTLLFYIPIEKDTKNNRGEETKNFFTLRSLFVEQFFKGEKNTGVKSSLISGQNISRFYPPHADDGTEKMY